jgi:hypothetical protein
MNDRPVVTSSPALLSRRAFVQTAGLALGGLPWIAPLAAQDNSAEKIKPFPSYADLLALLKQRGHAWRQIGIAPDKSPVVAVRAGGNKLPAVFISAGAHATEHAGVAAAVELIDRLQTEHAVWVVPTRDPIGLNGFRYALSLGLGETPAIGTPEEAERLLRDKGEILYEKDDVLLALLGEYGYAMRGL